MRIELAQVNPGQRSSPDPGIENDEGRLAAASFKQESQGSARKTRGDRPA